MARTEYYDDPDAPEPNSLVVAASAVVTDDRAASCSSAGDNGLWALPGGVMELTDSLPGTAVREVKEETGLDVEITGLVGTYTDPSHVIAYTDGEVRRQFNVCFTARIVGGHSRSPTSPRTALRPCPRNWTGSPCTPRSASASTLPGTPRASLSRLTVRGKSELHSRGGPRPSHVGVDGNSPRPTRR